MATYSVSEFLLDKSNIDETVKKLGWYYDTKSEEGLREEVYAPNVVIDYQSLTGKDPWTVTGPEWAAQAIRLVESFDACQHKYGHTIIRLPQPGTAPRPDRATALAQCTGTMVKKSVNGAPLLQDGGRAIFDVVRLPELEAKGENPWRITRQEVVLGWSDGNWEVMRAMD